MQVFKCQCNHGNHSNKSRIELFKNEMGGFVSMLIKLGLYCWSNDFNETSDVPLFFLL